MKKEVIQVPMWTSPVLSHAIRVGDLVYTAGQVGMDPQSGEPVGGDITVQTRRVLDNLKLILEAAGTSLQHAFKATVYLRNWDDYGAFNDAYRAYFPKDPPVRTTTQAGRLGGQYLVEIELVAVMPEDG